MIPIRIKRSDAMWKAVHIMSKLFFLKVRLCNGRSYNSHNFILKVGITTTA